MYCDCHIHLLPGVDNGPSDVAEASEMLHILLRSGVTSAVLTPSFDFRKETVSRFIRRRDESYRELLRHLRTEETENFRFVLSAEVELSPGISRVADLEKLSVGKGSYLPLSLPCFSYPDAVISELSALIHKRSIYPIVCNTERACIGYSAPELDALLYHLPHAVYQFGVKSLEDEAIFRIVTDLMRGDKTVLLGTNAHNNATRSPNTTVARRVFTERVDATIYEVLALKNKAFIQRQL